MPAFSRGGFTNPMTFRLPSSLRAALFGARDTTTPTRLSTTRTFTTTLLRRYAVTVKPSVQSARSTFLSNDPVLRQVTQTRQPVLLYRAPRSKWYYAKVYGIGALWIGVGAYSIKFNDDIKDTGLPFFVRPTYIVVGAAFIAIGCYICTAPTNRMRLLEVVPGVQGGNLQLRMAVKSAPWSTERVIYSNIGGATISEKTEPMVRELLEAERFRRQQVWQDLEGYSVLGKVWEGSARWVHQKWTNLFLRFKFAVLRFGVAKVKVQGNEWKIDCSGWLLEDGKAVDRLIAED